MLRVILSSVVLAFAIIAIINKLLAFSANLTPTPYPIEDQNTCTTPPLGSIEVSGSTWKAQTYVPSVSGKLIRVSIPGTNTGGITTLHIRPTTNGQPSDIDLGSANIQCGTVFDFGGGIQLVAGQLYTLVLSNGSGRYDWDYSSSQTCYGNPLGHPFTSLDNGNSWSQDIVDFYFTTYMLPDIPGGTPVVLPATCNPLPALTHPAVFVVAFPFANMPPLENIQILTKQIITQLKEGSRYHGYADSNAQPYLEFQIYNDNVMQHPTIPPKQPNSNDYDYAAVYTYYDLCNLIQNGQVDEVWFWDGGQGGFTEAITVGPEGTWSTGGPAANPPNCGKEVTTMTFNYTRLDVDLHTYVHRLEGVFGHYFPCDFWTETWPWTGWPPQCTGLVSDRYGYVGRPFTGNNNIGVCGDAHHPPNITDNREYVYNDTATVQSICEDWRQDGLSIVRSFNCIEWGCSSQGFFIWWMQNVPGISNTNKDRNGNPQPNWWTYMFGRPTAIQRLFLPLVVKPPLSLEVFSNQNWQDSGVTLAQGQHFSIQYISGMWTYSTGMIAPFDANGDNYICNSVNCCEPLPTVRKGALLGKVGNNTFFVGNRGTFTANSTGSLSLRMNDCDSDLGDNSGSIRVAIDR